MVVAIACVRRLWRRTPTWARRRHAAPAAPRRHRRGRRERWCPPQRVRGPKNSACGDGKSMEIPTFWRENIGQLSYRWGICHCQLGLNGFQMGPRDDFLVQLFPGKQSNFLWIFHPFLVQFPHCACCLARWKALGREAKTCSDLLGGDRHWRPHEGVVIVQLQPRWGNLGQG